MSSAEVHLSTDTLADLDADLLPAAELAAAHDHLRSCETCQSTRELLAGVPDLLAGAAAVPMPADVAARVVAAIEREQISRAGVPTGQADGARGRPERAGLRRRFGARLGAGLLGATAVLGGGYLVISGISGGGDDSPSAADAGEQASDLESTAEEDALGGSTDFVDESPAPSAVREELAYTSDSLDEQVLALVGDGDYATTRTEPGEVIGPDGQIGEPDDVLTRCIAATKREAGSKADPVAVVQSTFDDTPAVVIVFSGSASGSSASPLDVWVVGASCVGLSTPPGTVVDSGLDVLEHRSVSQ